MRKQLYLMVPDVDVCKKIVKELADLGISERHTHVIGSYGTPLEGVHEASILQKTEFSHGLEAGLGVGGVAGLLGGLLAVTFPPGGLVLGGGALLVTSLAGAGLGAVVSSLVAKDIPNHELEAFRDAIADGQILLIVDIPKSSLAEVVTLIREHHPEAEIGER